MEKHKEIGYELVNICGNNLKGFNELWNKADFDTKELIVNSTGKLAIKLCVGDKSETSE